ncbi:hypothetical protein SAMN05192553_10460 [Cyclobacterium xiamenense]|uniref:Lipocalin-like domain-containing protein n=1 Tax=Cyclobacterium xiamenense TaxID=1297121 RepID=A0A1H6Z1M1_9BACT|nr:hypothetical protein [Cyclobacterium xiamenense]SEJ45894.1 hypothetical protein SAMN05192553_10460 [Cyclobacterium xiamenense]
MKKIVLTFVSGLLLFSCMEEESLSALQTGPVPVGNWSNLEYQENGIAMEKVDELLENTYGYRFFSNGKLIHRANSGWCGTPPIVTNDYEGTWERNGEIIRLEAGFWGGTQIQELKIINETTSSLLLEEISSEWITEE